MRKWKWLVMTGCKGKSSISTVTEFLMCARMEKCTSVLKDFAEK
jgi:hypothetical protein